MLDFGYCNIYGHVYIAKGCSNVEGIRLKRSNEFGYFKLIGVVNAKHNILGMYNAITKCEKLGIDFSDSFDLIAKVGGD